jgi:mitotic spindle assembly checkpoint protein MAD2
VYPPEAFEHRRQYGLAIMVTSDARLAAYLATVLEALEGWLETGTLQRLVLVIAGTPEGDVLERWTFDVQADKAVVAGDAPPPEKGEADIMAEIGAVIRQITASVTFLPMLNRPCAFLWCLCFFWVGGWRWVAWWRGGAGGADA